MNIETFENDFEEKILYRGFNYYKNNAVINLERVSDDMYNAEVEGSEIYDVEFYMDSDGNIDDASCNCPYDWGYCKHIAAALYALQAQIKTKELDITQKGLSSLLSKCTKEQLLEIILDHAKEERKFRDILKIKFSDASDAENILSDFKKTADKIFSGYSDTKMLLTAAEMLFLKTEKVESPVDRIHIYAETLGYCERNIGTFYNTAYDEDFTIFEVINEAAEMLNAAVELIIADNDKKIIDTVWNVVAGSREVSYDYDEDRFFPVFLHFAVMPEYRKRIDEMLAADSIFADNYKRCSIDRKRFDIIERFGSENEKSKFIDAHLDDNYFRELAINSALSDGDYKKAERLAIDGENFDNDKTGLVKKWHKKRYEIYKASGNTEKLRDICRTLIIKGDKELYSEWKSLLLKENIDKEIQSLLNEKNNSSYEYIITAEKMTDRIYELCCKSIYKIPKYYGILKCGEFEEKGRELFEKYIRDNAIIACDRSMYKNICNLLKNFSDECDVSAARKIAADFRELYCRKPAFMDELNKSGF